MSTCRKCASVFSDDYSLRLHTKAVHDLDPAAREAARKAKAERAAKQAAETCDRHGGKWGDDETCEDCTDDDGNPKPNPKLLELEVNEDEIADAIFSITGNAAQEAAIASILGTIPNRKPKEAR